MLPFRSFFVFCSLSLFACAEPEVSGSLALSPCRIDGIRGEVLCGAFDVPEDRAAPNARTLSLRVVKIPALRSRPDPSPLFLFAGGPGQAATTLGPLVQLAFSKVRAERDIILVDQRGTGGSNPLSCQLIDGSLASILRTSWPVEEVRDCAKKLNADLRFYTTFDAIQDLDELRAALGYQTINLWGGSYGTRVALTYLQKYPERVRTAIVDGVAPYQNKLSLYMARDAQRALNKMFEDCKEEASCQKTFPALEEKFHTLLSSLRAAPIRGSHRHPRTTRSEDVVITADSVGALVRSALYIPEYTSLLPLVITRAAEGDFAPLLALGVASAQWSTETMSLGQTLSVLCAEDLPRITPEEVARETKDTFLGDSVFASWSGLCAAWTRAPLPPDFREEVVSSAPVLILSGELDPVTPPSWGEVAAKGLSNHLHVIVPGASHGVSHQSCVPELIASFLEKASVDGLDASCVKENQRLPFFLSDAGPNP
jgi:pimeloyl-ACP methyl ester carboxylesterase